MKKTYKPEVCTGIWIDQEKAYLVRYDHSGEPSLEKCVSGVESQVRFAGEGKQGTRFGQAFVDDQEKKQRRQRMQRLRFFRKVADAVERDDYLFLMGPGPAHERLHKLMLERSGFVQRIAAVEPADRLTRQKLLEKVRLYFDGPEFAAWKKAQRKLKKAL